MRKLYMMVMATVITPCLCLSQMQSVNIQVIVACGGATVIGQPVWNGTPNPTTIYFERQGAAGTWFEHRSMVYDYQTNHITLSPTDLSGPTNFRVRAVDMVTFEERISGGAALNPASWNVDRGTAFGTASLSWGSSCANPGSMSVTTNYIANGRPPFLIEYKRSSDPNYLVAGTVTAGTVITGILPGTSYQVRITDICGKVVNVNTSQLNFGVSTSILQPTNCNNGRFQIFPSGGIGPFTYGVFKRVASMGGLNPVINFDSTSPVFNNLGPGDYFYQAKDACGNLSRMELARLGGGFPFIQNFTFGITPGDSCKRNVTVIPIQGMPPLEYGVRYIHDQAYTWQTSQTFTLDRTGAYFFRTRDACGQVSDSLSQVFTIPAPQIDSVVKLSTSCVKDIRVYASGGYGPYEYAMSRPGFPNYTYQASNTFTNVSPGQHYVKVRDRCGREIGPMLVNDLVAGCALRYDHGDFEAANTIGCQTHSGSDWIDIRDDQNSIVFSINPQNNTIPDMCWGIRIIPRDTLRYATVNGSKAFFLDRNFYIEPPAGLTLTNPVLLRFYITYIELEDMVRTLQQNGYPNATYNDIRILKKKGSPGSPVDLEVINEGAASAGQFTVITPTIIPFGMEFAIEFAVNDFSELNPFGGPLGSALPLTLVAFDATTDNKDVVLKWKTTDEVNTKLFDVQWSPTGINFQKIGTVSSNNRPGINNYQFKHIAPGKGLNYYRLKQVDIDGKFTFSATIKVTVDNLSGLTVYPNPVYDQLQLRADATEIVRAVTITDAAGRLQLHMATTGNVRPVTIPVQKLSKGIYWLQVTTDRKTYRLKFIRQ